MLDKMSDTSRIVDRLVAKGLVNKNTSLTDKRLVDITISETGLSLLDRLEEKNYEMDSIVGNLSMEEAISLSTLLDKIRERK